MEKKQRLNSLVAGAGKTVKGLLGNAIQAVDQNDDGKFDLLDVAVIAQSVEGSVKKGTHAMRESIGETARQLELKALQPIFTTTLNVEDFHITKFIRVVDRDKRYAESEVCQGSIGYLSNYKDYCVVNVFRDCIAAFGIVFYPDSESEFYYVDPSQANRYIALDEYFSYLKIVRVNELQKIAQDLGAKRFRVTYKEEQTSFSEKKIKGNAKVVAKVDVDYGSAEKKYSTVEIAAEMECPGHEPSEPQLRYLQNDPSIQNLVAMRLNASAPLLHQKFMLKLSNSSGIKEHEAIKVDAVLKGLKCSGNTTVASEARNESRRFFEYDIEF